MRIGIDIDGVITDMERFILDYESKFCYENNIPYIINEKEYDEAKAFNITSEQAEKFWNEYLVYYATKYPARDFAVEIIKKLKNQNHEIYIITARNEYGLPFEFFGKMQSIVKQWLEDNKIEYDSLIFTNGSKLPYCLENKIDIMIEDSPKNIIDIATKIPVLCFNNSYNQMINSNNITRVYSWYDVLSKIENNG